ncbi:galactose mutarotase [Thermoclostridium stercorarium]|jgi:aldose 1-epimerase|uniref:Aldose 1-epimerase n=1 Tax=Thermoclostridium stercorarium subsp. leptospartum DSM 9219 TaxID=1346611 RepID=A0A1B1YJ94_THEST|nr:aldose epimerase family protein [Thermoclostridium stercorarium]ANX00782.1 galactose mutarotase [Thermoclostridium stercorarium subsp. leptospartum DSM 9219]UZQ86395.1 galactose mutarotase [Thermoclostridium stercorarium]
MSKKLFGKTPEGVEIYLFTIENSKGMKAEIINYGGIVVSLYVPDKNGRMDDVVLGCDSLEDYSKSPYFGAIIGRHANRIENAVFELNGKEYRLAKNDGNNHLHGGIKGFDKVVWDVLEHSGNSLKLHYLSHDGEEGYPGNLDITVTYSVTEDNALSIDYKAKSDADTVVNLTNHSYFNLSGHSSGDILKHQLKINADRFTVNNEECIPTGEIISVEGTPMDFRELKPLGPGIQSGSIHVKHFNGYDHNFVLNVSGKEPEFAAEVFDPASGRRMKVYTTKPGVQLYTGNQLNQIAGKGGIRYGRWSGFCLETQFFPNAMKHKHFPSPVLKAGELYHHITVYKFE